MPGLIVMEPKDTQRSASPRPWPKILNRFFIGIGVLAVCLFFAGKAFEAFKGEERVASQSSSESDGGDEKTLVLISKEADASGKLRDFSELETHFGNKIVFVSASEPAFLMTDDERRFEVGAIDGTDLVITNISSTRLVLRRDEELLVYALPDESAI